MAYSLPEFKSERHMGRMTLLFVVFALTLSPSSAVLCAVWCSPSTGELTDTARPCRHHAAPAGSAELNSGKGCGTAVVAPALYVREGSELQGAPPVVVIYDGGDGCLALTRSIRVAARVYPLDAAAFLTALRI